MGLRATRASRRCGPPPTPPDPGGEEEAAREGGRMLLPREVRPPLSGVFKAHYDADWCK